MTQDPSQAQIPLHKVPSSQAPATNTTTNTTTVTPVTISCGSGSRGGSASASSSQAALSSHHISLPAPPLPSNHHHHHHHRHHEQHQQLQMTKIQADSNKIQSTSAPLKTCSRQSSRTTSVTSQGRARTEACLTGATARPHPPHDGQHQAQVPFPALAGPASASAALPTASAQLQDKKPMGPAAVVQPPWSADKGETTTTSWQKFSAQQQQQQQLQQRHSWAAYPLPQPGGEHKPTLPQPQLPPPQPPQPQPPQPPPPQPQPLQPGCDVNGSTAPLPLPVDPIAPARVQICSFLSELAGELAALQEQRKKHETRWVDSS